MLFWFGGEFLKDHIKPPLNKRFRFISMCKISKHYLISNIAPICIVLYVYYVIAHCSIFSSKNCDESVNVYNCLLKYNTEMCKFGSGDFHKLNTLM